MNPITWKCIKNFQSYELSNFFLRNLYISTIYIMKFPNPFFYCVLCILQMLWFHVCWRLMCIFLSFSPSFFNPVCNPPPNSLHSLRSLRSEKPVFELFGCFHADFQPDLHYDAHWSLVRLSPVFGANVTRIPIQLLGSHQRVAGKIKDPLIFCSLRILPTFLPISSTWFASCRWSPIGPGAFNFLCLCSMVSQMTLGLPLMSYRWST